MRFFRRTDMTNDRKYRILYRTICLFVCMVFLLCGCQIDYDKLDKAAPNNKYSVGMKKPQVSAKERSDFDIFIQEPVREPLDFSLDRTTGEYFSLSDLSDRTLEKTLSSPRRLSAAFYYPNPKGLSQVSPVIVIGEIQDVYYQDTWSFAYPAATAVTFYDVKITQVLRGDYVVGDIITIADDGGYMRGEVYTGIGLNYPKWINSSHYVQYEHYGSAPTLEVGSSHVFFLQEHRFINTTYGIFEFVGGFTGVYSISADNTVSRYMQDSDPWTYGTLDELISAVAENPFNQTKYDEIYK